ncbi:MAG: hypothetical protein V4454_14020 [Pseudomonadota bacterium]
MKPFRTIVPVMGLIFLIDASVAQPPLELGASLNGGIGAEEQHDMQFARGRYNLRLTFAMTGTADHLWMGESKSKGQESKRLPGKIFY